MSQPTPTFADPDALMGRVSEMIASGRLGVARPLLAAVERLAPPSPRLAELSAWLLMRESRIEQAGEALDRALEEAPQDAPLRRRRAELRLLRDDYLGAASDAADAVVLAPGDPGAKALLGTALLGLGLPSEAAACLNEAVAAAPTTPGYRQGLAAAQEATGEPDEAAETLAEGIASCPRAVSLRAAAMMQRVRHGDFAGALAIAERARRDGVADASIHGLKGHALAALGRHDEAASAYADAVKLAAGDPAARPPGSIAHERAASDYVRVVFDSYAPFFEEHLLSFEYRVPGLIRASVLRQFPAASASDPVGPVLDIGCGTGMGAVALLGCGVGPFIGVDLSPAMLSRAKDKGLYAELHEADLLAQLQQDARRFPLVIAGDVLCYFGAMEALFAAVHRRLTPGGVFVFSCEEMEGNPEDADAPPAAWSLGPQGRYAHGHDYVVRCARDAGFLIVEQSREMLRRERGAPVMGCVMALERVQHVG